MDNPASGALPHLTQVFTSQGHLPAKVIKSKLEASGIPALLEYDSLSLVFGLTVDGIGQVRVMVPSERAAEARDLVADQDGRETHNPH